MIKRIIAFTISFCLIFEQSGFAQVAGQMQIPGYLANLLPADNFSPVQMRSVIFDQAQQSFQLMLDRGDVKEQAKQLDTTANQLWNYFQIGLRLPNNMFWVNLRPDAPTDIIDPNLEKTDLGRILLAADLQLKKDMARFTSPDTTGGRQYWTKLYAKAEQLYGQADMEIPTITRPWVVPGEVVIKETSTGAYIYKATLNVMLEQDYIKDSPFYDFTDPKQKEINAYSSELIRSDILPRLVREVNSSKRYAELRQVYYSVVLAQWFKARLQGQFGGLAAKIDSKDLTGLTSAAAWSKESYYNAYKKSFSEGEYNKEETVNMGSSLVVRNYFSGGFRMDTGTAATTGIVGTGLPTGSNSVLYNSAQDGGVQRRDLSDLYGIGFTPESSGIKPYDLSQNKGLLFNLSRRLIGIFGFNQDGGVQRREIGGLYGEPLANVPRKDLLTNRRDMNLAILNNQLSDASAQINRARLLARASLAIIGAGVIAGAFVAIGNPLFGIGVILAGLIAGGALNIAAARRNAEFQGISQIFTDTINFQKELIAREKAALKAQQDKLAPIRSDPGIIWIRSYLSRTMTTAELYSQNAVDDVLELVVTLTDQDSERGLEKATRDLFFDMMKRADPLDIVTSAEQIMRNEGKFETPFGEALPKNVIELLTVLRDQGRNYEVLKKTAYYFDKSLSAFDEYRVTKFSQDKGDTKGALRQLILDSSAFLKKLANGEIQTVSGFKVSNAFDLYNRDIGEIRFRLSYLATDWYFNSLPKERLNAELNSPHRESFLIVAHDVASRLEISDAEFIAIQKGDTASIISILNRFADSLAAEETRDRDESVSVDARDGGDIEVTVADMEAFQIAFSGGSSWLSDSGFKYMESQKNLKLDARKLRELTHIVLEKCIAENSTSKEVFWNQSPEEKDVHAAVINFIRGQKIIKINADKASEARRIAAQSTKDGGTGQMDAGARAKDFAGFLRRVASLEHLFPDPFNARNRLSVTGWVTSNKSSRDLIEDLIELYTQGKVTLISGREPGWDAITAEFKRLAEARNLNNRKLGAFIILEDVANGLDAFAAAAAKQDSDKSTEPQQDTGDSEFNKENASSARAQDSGDSLTKVLAKVKDEIKNLAGAKQDLSGTGDASLFMDMIDLLNKPVSSEPIIKQLADGSRIAFTSAELDRTREVRASYRRPGIRGVEYSVKAAIDYGKDGKLIGFRLRGREIVAIVDVDDTGIKFTSSYTPSGIAGLLGNNKAESKESFVPLSLDGGTKPGGIDLRAVPMVTQPGIGVPAIDMKQLQLLAEKSTIQDLEKEWVIIQKQIKGKQMPYAKMKEYVAVCCQRKAQDKHMNDMMACVTDILKLEEKCAVATSPEMKELLVMIEAGRTG